MEQHTHTYIAIDLKSFYASVECVERGLDPALELDYIVAVHGKKIFHKTYNIKKLEQQMRLIYRRISNIQKTHMYEVAKSVMKTKSQTNGYTEGRAQKMNVTGYGDYEDIINLPHPEPVGHPRMSMEKRAAQFSPFAALSGYEEAVLETERLTEERIILDEAELEMLDNQMNEIMGMEELPEVKITYFIPDERKSGGRYEAVTGKISRIDRYKGKIIMGNGTIIPVKEVVNIEIC